MSSRQTIIIGAGPAGLAVAAALRKQRISFALLEQDERIAPAWQHHYDRLHLHTPAAHSALPFLGFPSGSERYPSRDEVIAYLDRYAAAFDLQPEFSTTVWRCRRDPAGWIVECADGAIRYARHLVVACGLNRVPLTPSWPGQESFPGPIVHSSLYRNGEGLRGRRVLVVGFGNSGAEIAVDLVEHGAAPTIAMRSPVNIVPREVLGVPITSVGTLAMRLPAAVAEAAAALVVRVTLGNLSRCGLAPRPGGTLADIERRRRIPVIDVGTVDLIRAGSISVRGALERFDGEQCIFAGGGREAFAAVVLATGYATGLGALFAEDPSLLDDVGHPRAHGEACAPGLYFCGYDVVPTGALRQIGREAVAIAAAIAAHSRAG